MEEVNHGVLGEIIEVDDSTANPLFVVELLNGEELLVQAQEDFIIGVDADNKNITVDLPEGLLNLDEVGTEDE